MSKRIPLKYLTQFIARMYNNECPEYFAGHFVIDIRKAIIETFDVTSSIYFNVGDDDITVVMNTIEHNWTFKEYMLQCEQDNNYYMLNNLRIIWDTLQEFKKFI